MTKRQRHAAIIDILAQNAVQTQDELREHLTRRGVEITQATVSRDMRDMKIVKVSDGRGGYRYAVPDSVLAGPHHHIKNALADAILQVDKVGPILVLHTLAGMAQAVAAEVDKLRQSTPELVGCVAGDDTILVVVRDDAAATLMTERLASMIRSQASRSQERGER